MQVECARQIDASEPDETGMYEYYYEYDMYRFTDGSICFVARSYIYEPDETHFLRVEASGHPRSMVKSDLMHPLFLAAQVHLRAAGKVHLRWLSGRGDGYEPVPSGSHYRT